MLKVGNPMKSRLTIYRPLITDDSTLLEPKFTLDIKKLISIFPPDFIHSMDSMVVHFIIERNYNLNQHVKPLGIMFGLYTVHDNFSLGRHLFPILPLLIIDSYKELYNYDHL